MWRWGMRKKIAYQGTRASFSEMAIQKFFSEDVECVGKVTFEDVFATLEKGEVELAALPVENTLIGPIVENFDLFSRYEITVVGELCLPIEHCLVGRKGQKLEEIKKVYSHPKALAQCVGFFREHPWMEPMLHYDTAGAVKQIADLDNPQLAAIGSRKTAEVYQLEILKTHLEDDKSNTTRFLFLKQGALKETQKKEGKCSLLFTLKHVPGALAAVLTTLAEQGVNLTQIVSRPIREKPFEYLFFVDILFSEKVSMEKVLELMRNQTEMLKLLGLYEPAK